MSGPPCLGVDQINPGNPGRHRVLNPDARPFPESPAPPVIILAESSGAQAAPHIQVPDPAGAGEPQEPHALTSSSSAEQPSQPRYNLRKRKQAKSQALHLPEEPQPPEPNPAPPVIILPRKRPASSSLSGSISPDLILPETPDSITGPPTDTTNYRKHIMGSKASKLGKTAPVEGKLQASQERKDKEEMKEPSNYYTHRSKSMRRKAGKGGAASVGAGGSGSGGAGVV